MRRCGVCFVVVQGRVEASGLETTGVLNGGSRSVHSRTLNSWSAFSARDRVFASRIPLDRSSSVPVVPIREGTCSGASGLCGSRSSRKCLVLMSNCKNSDASFLYLASSAPRLGPETCTRISIGGAIVCRHLEKSFLLWGS